MAQNMGFHGTDLKAREAEKRCVLKEYLLAGGSLYATGIFRGSLRKLEYNKVLLKNLHVRFKNKQGKIVEGMEDHVWLDESKPFQDAGAKEGDTVQFNAYARKYRRTDGLSNYGLCRPKNVSVV